MKEGVRRSKGVEDKNAEERDRALLQTLELDLDRGSRMSEEVKGMKGVEAGRKREGTHPTFADSSSSLHIMAMT